MLMKQLDYKQLKQIKKFCDRNKIEFLCTAFDLEGIKFLKENLKMKFIKFLY